MHNHLSLTEFIRTLKAAPLGYAMLWHVPQDKSYTATVSGLTATAAREGVKISTAQVMLVEPGKLVELAVKVTAK